MFCKNSFIAGFFQNVALLGNDRRTYTTVVEQFDVQLHPSSVLANQSVETSIANNACFHSYVYTYVPFCFFMIEITTNCYLR